MLQDSRLDGGNIRQLPIDSVYFLCEVCILIGISVFICLQLCPHLQCHSYFGFPSSVNASSILPAALTANTWFTTFSHHHVSNPTASSSGSTTKICLKSDPFPLILSPLFKPPSSIICLLLLLDLPPFPKIHYLQCSI